MVKSTGKEVSSEVTFISKKSDGEVTVSFTFDGYVKDTEIVVFESLYRDETKIAIHLTLKMSIRL